MRNQQQQRKTMIVSNNNNHPTKSYSTTAAAAGAPVSKPSTPTVELKNLIFLFIIFGSGLAIGLTIRSVISPPPRPPPFQDYVVHDHRLFLHHPHHAELPTRTTENTSAAADHQASTTTTANPPTDNNDDDDDDEEDDTTTDEQQQRRRQRLLSPPLDHKRPPKKTTGKGVNHGMDDEELMWRASMVPKITEFPYKRVPKLAFLFLTKGPLPLAPLWDRFFRGNEQLYSVYVHAASDDEETASFHYYYSNSNPNLSAVFRDRLIPSQKVSWGKFNMIEAELRLLATALLDINNERFILLSESCIPLFSFATIYTHLTTSPLSHIDSYDLPTAVGRGRYRHRMSPYINISDWRKGSQWFEMGRGMAVDVVSQRDYFRVFRNGCDDDVKGGRSKCYADEHYLPTLVHMMGYGARNANRSLTWVDWSRGGWHPATYGRRDVTPDLLHRLRTAPGGGGRTNKNNNNDNKSLDCGGGRRIIMGAAAPPRTPPCYLFARKFLPDSLDRLLRMSKQNLLF